MHDELWKDLLGVLKGSIDVIAPCDNDRDLERLVVCLDHTFCSSLGGRVRVAWRQ